MSNPNHITHDVAARLIGVTPGELTALVNEGQVRRTDKNAYLLPVLVQDYIGHLKSENERRIRAPKQAEIAAHLDLSTRALFEFLQTAQMDHKQVSLDEIRIAYIRHLRGVASGHRSNDGLDLTHERVLTERVDRELKLLLVAEKRGQLINVEQLEPELMNMISAFRAELLARDDKLKSDLDALYGIELDLNLLNEHTRAALAQLARYDTGGEGVDTPLENGADAIGADGHGGMGAQA